MKAKEVISRMQQAVAVKVEEAKAVAGAPADYAMTPEEVGDVQATEFIRCAWEEFRRVVQLRFGQGGRQSVGLRSVLSLRQEFSDWGTCVARKSGLPWMRDNCGRVAFDMLFDLAAKATPGAAEVSIGVLLGAVPDGAGTDRLRTGL